MPVLTTTLTKFGASILSDKPKPKSFVHIYVHAGVRHISYYFLGLVAGLSHVDQASRSQLLALYIVCSIQGLLAVAVWHRLDYSFPSCHTATMETTHSISMCTRYAQAGFPWSFILMAVFDIWQIHVEHVTMFSDVQLWSLYTT